MAAASAVWDRNQFNNSTGKEEKLFLFGYSCKIFRDDEKASYITQGKHLIPWMGDDTLWIDRYDVRGYLHDLKPYETNPGVKYEDPLAEEEKLCDEERYLALKSNLTEEQLYQEIVYGLKKDHDWCSFSIQHSEARVTVGVSRRLKVPKLGENIKNIVLTFKEPSLLTPNM